MTTAANDGTGLDGAKAIAAAFEIAARAPPAAKIIVDRLRLPVGGVMVATGGVGLPNLDQRILERRAGPIDHPSLDAHALALGLRPDHPPTKVIAEDVKPALARHQTDMDIGAGRLRGGLLQVVEGLDHH